MPSQTMDSPLLSPLLLLLLLALLVPLHFLSLRSRLLRRPSGRRLRTIRSLVLFTSIPIVLSLAVSDLHRPNTGASVSLLDELKLKIAQLEFVLGETTEALSSKTLNLEKYTKLVDNMEQKIELLQNALYSNQEPSSDSYSKERLNAMEGEVRRLWEESHSNNFNIHALESDTHVLEEKLEAVAAEVEKMESIVTEQWIQIRQLEQSLHMTKTMITRESQKRRQPNRCTIFKFFKSIGHDYLPDSLGLPDSIFLGNSMSNSWMSCAFDRVESILLASQKWHHKLQDYVRQSMKKNEFTSALANKEIVFLVLSASQVSSTAQASPAPLEATLATPLATLVARPRAPPATP